MCKKVWVRQAKEDIICLLVRTLVVESRLDTHYKLAYTGDLTCLLPYKTRILTEVANILYSL